MTRGVNKVILVGRLGQDPEVRYMQNGTAVANVSVATSEQWKDKQTGENKEKTEWHRVVFFARLAEVVGEYLRKGAMVYVEGSIQTRKWQDQEGNERYTTEIKAYELQMLGRNGESQNLTPESQTEPKRDGIVPDRVQPQPAQAEEPQNFDNFDDDIPF